MKITRHRNNPIAGMTNQWPGWHILTVAEAGFSMLDIYGRHQHGLSVEVIKQFADRVNQRDEAGSLHPRAPVSAVPRRFFREQNASTDSAVINALKHCIVEFLAANRNTIHAQRIVVDFNVSDNPVSPHHIHAVEETLRLNAHKPLEEVVIIE